MHITCNYIPLSTYDTIILINKFVNFNIIIIFATGMEIIFAKNYLKELYLEGMTHERRYRFQKDIMIEIEGVDPQMILSNLKPKHMTHPGEIILDELEYMKITQKEFAERIGVSCPQVNQILKCRRPVNTEFALLTEAAIGIPADLLLRMQARHDIWQVENKPSFMEKLKKIKRFAAAL